MGSEIYAKLEQEQWRIERNAMLSAALRSVLAVLPACDAFVDYRNAGYVYARKPCEKLLAVFSKKTGALSWFDNSLQSVGIVKSELEEQFAVHSGS